MELRHLRYFVAVAEELSFTKAAALLNVSQPPISRQIMQLEAEIGAPLFERSKQYVKLTDAGQHLYKEARGILSGIQSAVESTRSVATGQIGRLSLGLGGTAAYLLPDILATFRQRYPKVQLVLEPFNLAYHRRALLEEKIDIGLVVLPLDEEGLSIQPLTRMPLYVALSTDHVLAPRKALSLKDLASHDFVMVPWSSGQGFGQLIMRVCRRAGFIPHIAQFAEPMESVVGMVAAGAGLAIVPESMRRLSLPKVVYRPIQERYAVGELAVAWRAADSSPIIKAFLSCCPYRAEKI